MSQSPSGECETPPVLVLTSLRGSHPFQERRIVLNEVIKVGRSVARLKPAANNAIFDCKVLSRSHALIWYKEGRFWLRDTNSSNGTFVNNTRVVKVNGEEFADREIFSGDIIRFGVDVIERDTTHGCIIAQVTLYTGNGCEAKPNFEQTGVVNGMVGVNAFHSEQVFLLFNLANEALFREQSLVGKLDDLKSLVSDLRDVSESGWHAMLREDRLLEKLALYESQLSLLKEDLPQDSLQNHLCQALEDKMNLEKASKIMLARVLSEKTEAMSKAADLERSLADSERECAHLREVCETTQEAYRSLTSDFQSKVQELEQLEQQLKTVTTEKEELESQLKERIKEGEALQNLLTSMKSNVKNKFTKVPSSNVDDTNEAAPIINGLENGPSDNVEQIDARLSRITEKVCELRDKVGAAEKLQSSLTQRVDAVRDEVALAELNELDRFCEIQERLADSEANFEQMLDSTSDCISMQLTDSIRQFNQSMQLIKSLQDELSTLAKLKSSLIQEMNSTSSVSSITISCDTSEPSHVKEPDHPNQSDDVLSSPLDEDHTADQDFMAVLNRARQLAARLATSQAHAEVNLSRYCSQQVYQKAPSICHTSGDVFTSPPSNPDKTSDDFGKTDELSFECDAIVPLSTAPIRTTQIQSSANSRRAEVESSVDETELAKLREELRQAIVESESFKQMALDYKEQDASKSELLMSVREECDVLRNRIAQIESEVATSREDHQRLVSEARRARCEADDLREERDTLSEQVSNCNHQIEQLRTALAKTLLGVKDLPSESNSPSNTTSIDLDSSHTVDSSLNLGQHTSAPNDRSKCVRTSDSVSCSVPAPMGMFPLFAIIPIMVLLCAIMVFIFSKFAR